jgi:hypothetical protein
MLPRTEANVVAGIIFAAVAVGIVFLGPFVRDLSYEGIDGLLSRFLTMVLRGRIAFSRTAHLQQARLSLDPFQLNPADLGGLDHFNGSWLHKVAQSEITRLVAALSATDADPDNPGRDRALACYDAAALLAAEREDRLDLLGAVVLAREGQTALADRDPLPLPACQVHPLHGPAVRRRATRQRVRRQRLRSSNPRVMCAECEKCTMVEWDKRALLVAGVPYYRKAGFWATVGFGALDPELPARVLEYMDVG